MVAVDPRCRSRPFESIVMTYPTRKGFIRDNDPIPKVVVTELDFSRLFLHCRTNDESPSIIDRGRIPRGRSLGSGTGRSG